jgi:histidinol-phosphatase
VHRTSTDSDLAFALELADAADALTLRRFGAVDLEIVQKPDLTPVTDADTAVERRLRELIRDRRPGEGMFGEEDGGTASGARWIVDPIDGTKNFTRGIPIWGTLVALERGEEIVCGVVSAPALGHRWWAALGQGAFRDGERISVSTVTRLADASVSAAYGLDLRALEEPAFHARSLGDFWQHVLVAEGSLDAAVDAHLELWDYAALIPIVEQAGGRVSGLDGGPPQARQQLVTSNGLLHDELLQRLSSQ